VRLQAEEQGYRLLATSASDIFQVEASFIMQGGRLAVIAHVPMARVDDRLEVYQYIPIPIKISAQALVQFQPTKDIIAINTEGSSFRTMTTTQLLGCEKRGTMFLCKEGNVVQKGHTAGGEKGCIFHLFAREFNRANATCDTHIVQPKDDIIAISPTEFVITAKEAHAGNIRCPGHREQSFSVNRITKVTMEPGCQGETYSHKFSARLEIDHQTDRNFQYTWPWAKESLLKDLDVVKYDTMRLNSSLLEEIPTETKEAAAWVRAKERYTKAMRPGIPWLWIIGGIILVLSIVGGAAVLILKFRMGKGIASVTGMSEAVNGLQVGFESVMRTLHTPTAAPSAPPGYASANDEPRILNGFNKRN